VPLNSAPLWQDLGGVGRVSGFLGRFRTDREAAETGGPKPPGTPPTIMPGPSYAGMREEDLGAIYEYLRTVEPIRHRVRTYERTPADGGR
jgi:hypothetical protein